MNFVRLTEHKSVLVKERFFPLIFTELVRARLFKRAGGILLVRTMILCCVLSHMRA